MSWTKLAAVSNVPPGSLVEIERADGDDPIALCNAGGEIRAISGICPHQGGPLGEGTLHGEIVVCPWHMWEFNSATGVCSFNEDVTIPTYRVRVENGSVLVDLP
jgi:nitrite reductase/ring-hydroxylating ferredoxin subunit